MLSSALLGLGAGILIGLAFLGGLLVGAWQQRKVGFKTGLNIKSLFEAAGHRAPGVSEGPPPPVAQWGIGAEPRGKEHPSGPPKPTPEALAKRDPTDWATKILKRAKPD
jgi:hypothetical protein